jgi:FSR family fosmidomycin resistance protein-like MFS transporter
MSGHVVSAKAASAPRVSLRELFRGREWPVFLVLVVGSLRIIAAVGVPILLGFLLTARNWSEEQVGFIQSAFMFGIGLGGLTCATLLRRHHERATLWLCPLVVTPVLLAIPWTGGWVLSVLSALSGLLLGISLPILVSRGQELMPESPRVASAITMGVSWGAGGAVVSIVLFICKATGHFEPAFAAFAVATLASSVLCAWLPEPNLAAGTAPAVGGKTTPLGAAVSGETM